MKMKKYWVITESEDAFGSYEDYESAYYFARTVFGFDNNWTITCTECEEEKVTE